MTSPVDICNRALAEVKARATIADLGEPSPEAVTCSLFYDAMRKVLLRAAHWGFARQQIPLSLLGSLMDGTAPWPWSFKYEYPAETIRLRYLLGNPVSLGAAVVPIPGTLSGPYVFQPSRKNRFLVASEGTGASAYRVVLTNVQSAIGVFTADVTNPDLFDPMFEEALVAALGSKLVIPLSGEIGMKGEFEKQAFSRIQTAREADGNEALPTTDHVPDWISGRQGGFFLNSTRDDAWNIGTWYNPWDQVAWGA